MININNGTVTISEELVVFPGYSFEQFQKTKFYKNQDGIRMIYLDEELMIENRKYIVSLFFRNGKLYMLSLICCDKRFSESDERKRETLHDDILKEWGMKKHEEYRWGKVSSDYDGRSNISSINIVYL